MVALGGTLAYISPGTLAYWKNVFIPIQVCSRTHVYQKTLPEFLSVFPVRYNILALCRPQWQRPRSPTLVGSHA
jgi:hypothetical protein